jgi:hypothetical protein
MIAMPATVVCADEWYVGTMATRQLKEQDVHIQHSKQRRTRKASFKTQEVFCQTCISLTFRNLKVIAPCYETESKRQAGRQTATTPLSIIDTAAPQTFNAVTAHFIIRE